MAGAAVRFYLWRSGRFVCRPFCLAPLTGLIQASIRDPTRITGSAPKRLGRQKAIKACSVAGWFAKSVCAAWSRVRSRAQRRSSSISSFGVPSVAVPSYKCQNQLIEP